LTETGPIALITAEYLDYRVNDKLIPTVVLIGRDVKTKKKVMYRTKITPYFFIEEDIYKEKKPYDVLASFGVIKEEYTTIRSPWGKPLRKLYISNPHRLEKLLAFLRKYHSGGEKVQLYAAELATPRKLPLRFLLDKGIRSGFKIVNGKIEPVEVDCPLRIWMMDFEVLSKLINSVNPYRDEPIIMVTFWDSYTDEYVTVHCHKKQFKPLFPNHKVIRVPTERHLLLYLQGCLDKKYNPDLIAAHNLTRFDLVKWCLRLEELGLDKNGISPKPFRFVDRRSFPFRVKGRIMCDLLEALKVYTAEEFDSYALEYLVEALELDVPKVPFNAPIADLWNDAVEIDFDSYPLKEYFIRAGITKEEFRPSYIVLLRNVLDVMAMKAYNDKFQLIDFFDSLRKEFGGLFEDMMVHNQMIETGILRMINNRIALPSKRGGKERESYRGAFVVQPEPGYYTQVAVLDFSREYPNLIQKLNVSPETYIKMGPEWIGREKEFVEKQRKLGNHVVYQPSITRELPNGVKVTERAQVYVFKRKPKGIIPTWVAKTFRMRDKWEEKEREAIKQGNEHLAKLCGMRAYIAKIAGNAAYGWMSYTGSPLYSKDCSAAVALCGYLASQKLIEFLQELGYKTVYGDTDSVFYQLKPGEGLEDVKRVRDILNRKLAEWCTKEWNIKESPFHLSIKMLFSDFVVLTKKRYGGKYYYHEKKGFVVGYEWKGLEIVRSDSSMLEKEVQREVLKLILDRQPEKIPGYWAKVEARLMRQEYEPIEVAYPTAIKKKLVKKEYQGREYWMPVGYKGTIPAHVRAVIASNQLLGTDFRQGDKPRRLPINSDLLRYPKEIEILTENGIVRKPLKDIAIDEYYILPEKWRKAIDWKRIRDRLFNKVNRIVKDTKLLTSLEGTLERWLS